MAQGMHISSVAEGVENQQQASFLRERNCDYIQGYLFSKPLPVEELEKLLRKGGSLG
jgi:EAL domain-containing protein (putative c-di-GMP-specific phosphodiesterase class I)